MQLKSNGGTMLVTHKAKMAGYHAHVWYDKRAITNILALSNVIKQYQSHVRQLRTHVCGAQGAR